MKSLINLSLLSLMTMLFTLVSCGGSSTPKVDSGGTPENPIYGEYNSNKISMYSFVKALKDIDHENSYVVLESNNSVTNNWYVIWDAEKKQYKAVSLSYIRSIVYYDYYSNNNAVAKEFRNQEAQNIANGNTRGVVGDYEVVYSVMDYDFDTNTYRDAYRGQVTGRLYYEDEAQSHDVSLLAREKEEEKFFRKAANISYVFNVSIETSMSMITLGAKLEKIISRNNGELTQEDQLALVGDFTRLTGVSMEELQKASESQATREEVLKKVASKIGTSVQNLEQRLLPEVFGLSL